MGLDKPKAKKDLVRVASQPPGDDIHISGVESVMRLHEEIYPGVRIAPSYPGLEEAEDLWLLSSWRIDLVLKPFAAMEPRYRIVKPFPWVYKKLRKKLAILNPLLLWLSGDQFECAKSAKACASLGIPYVFQYHTYGKFYILSRIYRFWAPLRILALWSQRRRTVWIAENACIRLAPSRHSVKMWHEWTGRHDIKFDVFRTRVKPFPLMDDETKECFRQKFLRDNGIPEHLHDREITGNVSRVMLEKGTEKAILSHAVAVRKCEEEGKKPPILIFVGGGSSRSFLRRLKRLARRLGISDLVFFVGAKPPSEAMKFLQICKICILLSISETQGLVRDEARLAKSIPIVLRDTALAEDLNDDRLIQDDDPKQIGELIHYLLNNPELMQEIAEQHYRVALEENDPDDYAREYLEIVETAKKANS